MHKVNAIMVDSLLALITALIPSHTACKLSNLVYQVSWSLTLLFRPLVQYGETCTRARRTTAPQHNTRNKELQGALRLTTPDSGESWLNHCTSLDHDVTVLNWVVHREAFQDMDTSQGPASSSLMERSIFLQKAGQLAEAAVLPLKWFPCEHLPTGDLDGASQDDKDF